jgi:hypothetical protein
MRAEGFQPFDHLEQMRERSRQTIDTYDDKDVAGADARDRFGEFWPGLAGARRFFLEDDQAAVGRTVVAFP